jgi:nitrite reductase (NADH) small subunit
MNWATICPYSRLTAERGVAALVDETQVAVFRTFDGSVFAISNIDPFTGSAVLSRGIVGNRGESPTVASPLHKQVFDLESGQCLDDPAIAEPVFAVRVRDGLVEVDV